MKTAIKIDIDTPTNWETYCKNLTLLNINLKPYIQLISAEAYSTTKGKHLYFTTEQEISTPLLTILLQLLLESDKRREMFNLKRILDGRPDLMNNDSWNVLFKEKYKQGKKVSQETPDEQLTQQLNGALKCEPAKTAENP